MKKAFWLMSAIGLSMTAHAQSGTITITSASKSVKVVVPGQPATQVINGDQLDSAIDALIANSNQTQRFANVANSDHEFLTAASSNAGLTYSQEYAQTRDSFNAYNAQYSSSVATLDGSAAPSVAARAASRAALGRSVGRCALYVRKALQSAGYKFTPLPSAYQYAHGTLAGAGFTKISNNNYVPQVGDVVVFNRTSKNPHGHIQIYDGNQWISDFRQNKFSPYAQHNGYTVWRDSRYLDASSTSGTYLAMNEQ